MREETRKSITRKTELLEDMHNEFRSFSIGIDAFLFRSRD